MHTHQDVPIGIHFKQVSIHGVEHQPPEENGEGQCKQEAHFRETLSCQTDFRCEPAWWGRMDRRRN